MHWQGVAMLEYRWDQESEEFFLIEMNGRFWGSLHLALYAGVDFPSWFLDCFHGHSPQVRNRFAVGIRCRHTFPKEVHYVWSRLKDRQVPWYSQLWSVLEFFQLMADPRVYSDLLFPGDRKLYWINFKNFLLTFWKKEDRKAHGVGR
jgi:biotin carboxylase